MNNVKTIGNAAAANQPVKAHFRWLRNVTVAGLLCGLTTLPTVAATFTVTNLNDSGTGSLREAIANAANGDTINFTVSPGTILLSTPLMFGPSVTINGIGDDSNGNPLLAISGGDSVAVLVVNAGATVNINDITIENGASLLGGGIFNAGSLVLNHVTVTNCTMGTQLGGGIFNSGTLSVINSTISNNHAGYGVPGVSGETGLGGGIYNYGATGGGTLILIGSTINNNFVFQGMTGTASGGGIYNDHGMVALLNSTVAQNLAQIGGAIFNNGGTLTFSFSTLTENDVDMPNTGNNGVGGGGALYDLSGTVIAKNSIFANSSFNTGTGPPTATNCVLSGGTYTSKLYNLSNDLSCTALLSNGTDLINIPAGLDPRLLQENGGPTQTVALLATSPAVNAIPLSDCTDVNGNPVKTDQRGVPRPRGSGCDIGAFEFFQSLFQIQAVEIFLIIDSVQPLPLPAGRRLVLLLPLEGAVYLLNRGFTNPAVVLLQEFVVLVKVMQRDGELTSQQATPLIASAQQIVQELLSPKQPIP